MVCRVQPFQQVSVGHPGRAAAPSCARKAAPTCAGVNKRNEPSAGKSILAAIASAGLSAALLSAPLPSLAVSGGGGMATALSFQDFSNANLSYKKFVKAELRSTNFNNANLTGASLFGALAPKSTFVGANLTGADLESTDLEDADLTNAILEGAQLTNAQLKSVTITGSDWTDVVLRKDVQRYLCSIADGTNPMTGNDTRDTLLCP